MVVFRLTLQLEPDGANIDEDDVRETLLDVSVDGAWQKRGSGKTYNSLSGTISLIFYYPMQLAEPGSVYNCGFHSIQKSSPQPTLRPHIKF